MLPTHDEQDLCVLGRSHEQVGRRAVHDPHLHVDRRMASTGLKCRGFELPGAYPTGPGRRLLAEVRRRDEDTVPSYERRDRLDVLARRQVVVVRSALAAAVEDRSW